ncbi:HAMP domain-containing histidine kinase [Glycomyces sp. L485]|uniref:sensor histidine kinase n=1 Tax=Glycomyces sp. L485 TaxID=2909235 RepID=UPI001F4B0E57|nr:HAMP domain-containing sensor histidine kinase [Glycomyces sp. L485]MCH7231703.1 HAMP domain-containing histidine kinase [Glycomyces sp. L485]
MSGLRIVEAVRERWDRTPLRVRLTAAVLALVAGSLILISVSTILALHSYFLSNVDEELEDTLLKGDSRSFSTQSDGEAATSLGVRPNQYIFSLVDDDGNRIDVPANRSDSPVFSLEDLRKARGEGFTALAADGTTRWRVLALPGTEVGTEHEDYDPKVETGERAAHYVLSYRLAHFDKTVAGLVWVDILIGTGVLAGLAALGVGLVRASLSPLRQIENTAAMIAAGNYSRRVPDHDPATEVGRVGYAINSMLGKIESSIRAREHSEGRAHDSERRMREFIADASHELRTPLTSVRGFAELVRANPDMPEADRQHYIGQIEDAAKRMGLLVGDLLHLARLDQERPVETEPVELAVLGHEAVTEHAVVAESHEFEFKSAPGAPTVVAVDRARIRQVLDNLLTNAVRHTSPGTRIVVEVAADGDDVVMRVADDGPGMTPATAERVFERFFRSEVVSHPGSGLGLAIVAAIVKAHGGTVSVQSEPGRGTVFTVRLGAADDPGRDPEEH